MEINSENLEIIQSLHRRFTKVIIEATPSAATVTTPLFFKFIGFGHEYGLTSIVRHALAAVTVLSKAINEIKTMLTLTLINIPPLSHKQT